MTADDLARSLSEDDRKAVARQLAVARQKVRSAALLWSSDQFAEGLRLAREGVSAARAALDRVAQARGLDGDPLAVLGVSAGDLSRVREAEQRASSGAPELVLNGDFEPAHESAFGALVTGAETMMSVVARVARPRRRIVLTWPMRLGLAAAGGILLAGVLVLATRHKPEVQASAYYGNDPRFQPANVLGDTPGEWLLPTGAKGWIEVTTGGGRIKALKLQNAWNPPFNDRATIDYRIECFHKGKVVHTGSHTFGPFKPSPEAQRIPLDLPNVDRVRIHVDSFHHLGGGLAAVSWE